MYRQIKRCCLLLLALPLVAMAGPVTVTTHSTGKIATDVQVLQALGFVRWDTFPSNLPDTMEYVLTMRSTFDPGVPAPWSSRLVQDYSSDIVLDFVLGGDPYHYAGKELSQAWIYERVNTGEFVYSHETRSYSSEAIIHLSQSVVLPATILGSGDPLEERAFSGVGGVFSISAFSYPNWTASTSGDISTFSVQVTHLPVTSPVPEPASWTMVALALLPMALRRYRGRKSPGQAA